MQEFMFAPVGDGTYSVSGYKGDEKDVVIPDSYGSGVYQPGEVKDTPAFKVAYEMGKSV